MYPLIASHYSIPSFQLNPQHYLLPMVISWTPENDRKFLLLMLRDVKANFESIFPRLPTYQMFDNCGVLTLPQRNRSRIAWQPLRNKLQRFKDHKSGKHLLSVPPREGL
jgi:hypothetical protein